MAENLQTIMQNRMDEKRAADLEAQANRENQISKLDTDQAAARDRTVGEGVYPSTTVPAEPVDKFPALEPSGGKGVFKSPAPEFIREYGEELAPVPIVDFAIKKNVIKFTITKIILKELMGLSTCSGHNSLCGEVKLKD